MNKHTSSSGNSAVVGILVLVVILIVGWIAYSQGFFEGKAAEDQNGGSLEINLGGGEER